MSLNSVLFWLATVSCVVLVARTLPSLRQGRGAGWVLVAVVILVVGGSAEAFFPAYAGVIAGTLWLVLIVLPSLLIRAVLRHALGQRYVQAECLAKLVRCLIPVTAGVKRPNSTAHWRWRSWANGSAPPTCSTG